MTGANGNSLICPICGEPSENAAFQELPVKLDSLELSSSPTSKKPFDSNSAVQDLTAPELDRSSTAITVDRPGAKPQDSSTAVMLRFPVLRRERVTRPVPDLPGYEILEEIGQGNTSIVYKAREASSQKIVAIKVFVAGDYAQVRNFASLSASTEKLKRLQHPCIVQFLSVGQSGGKTYLVTEYVDGGNMREKFAGRPQPVYQCAQIAETLARTLDYAHQQSILHRDLQPAKILLTSDGLPKIADFGLAQQPGPGDQKTPDVWHGNPSYLAPEQLRGRVRDIGPATDIYSLGAVLYEMLTGRPPYLGTTSAETAALARSTDPLLPRQIQRKVPQELENICLMCLRSDPVFRYANALFLAEDLRNYLVAQPIQAKGINPLTRGWRWAKEMPIISGVCAGLLLILLGLVIASRQAKDQLRSDLHESMSTLVDARRQIDGTRRHLYLADMNLAMQAFTDADPRKAVQLLEKHQEAEDLRSFEWGYLWRASHSELRSLRGHSWPIDCLAVAADGTTLASACAAQEGKPGSEIWIWDTLGTKDPVKVRVDSDPVTALAFAPNLPRMASGGKNGTLEIRDAATGQFRTTFARQPAGVLSLAFHPSEQILASGSGDGIVRLYNAENGTEAGMLPGHSGGAGAIAFSRDGKLLAVASLGDGKTVQGEVRFWDWATKQDRNLLQGHSGSVRAVAFSPVADLLASASATAEGGGEVRLWDTRTGRQMAVLPGVFAGVNALAFSPDGRTLAVGRQDAAIQIWNMEAGPRLQSTLLGHSSKISGLAYSGNGRTLASAAADGLVKLWSPAQAAGGPVLRGHTQPVQSLAFSNDGFTLVTGAGDTGSRGEVKVWDIASAREQASLIQGSHSGPVLGVAVSAPGKLLATASEDTSARLWDLNTGKLQATLTGHNGKVRAVAFSPTSPLVATGSWDGTVRLWNTQVGRNQGVLPGNIDYIWSVAFSPDGMLLAAAGSKGLIKLWDVTGKLERATLKGHGGAVTAVVFSPDGKKIATASLDQTVRIWDAASGQQLAVFRGHEYGVTSVAFAPDGKTVASGSRDETVRLWDVESGDARGVLRGHTDWVLTIAFSGDGKTLASGGVDKTVKLWMSSSPEKPADAGR